MKRDEAIRRIKAALERRSGKRWSVTGGRGTAWGWLNIDVPPARRVWSINYDPEAFPDGPSGRCVPLLERAHYAPDREPGNGYAGLADCCELAVLLDLTPPVHFQGVSVPPDSWEVYARKAEGETGQHEPEHYWD